VAAVHGVSGPGAQLARGSTRHPRRERPWPGRIFSSGPPRHGILAAGTSSPRPCSNMPPRSTSLARDRARPAAAACFWRHRAIDRARGGVSRQEPCLWTWRTPGTRVRFLLHEPGTPSLSPWPPFPTRCSGRCVRVHPLRGPGASDEFGQVALGSASCRRELLDRTLVLEPAAPD